MPKPFTVRQAVAGLSDAHRTTLLLHYVGGWSREEVAAILEVPRQHRPQPLDGRQT